MIKAVVFDLDDTLICEKEYIKSGFKYISKLISQEHNIEAILIYESINKLFEENTKKVFDRLLDKLNIKYDMEYINYLIFNYRNHIPSITLYPDAQKVLDYLRESGIKLGMITDGYKIIQRNKLKVLNIEDYFECIVVTDELGREYWKPHIKPYQIVKESMGLEYDEMVYVGDNISKDFITANNIGMNTIMICREEGIYYKVDKTDEYKANITINNLNELIEVLKLS